MAFLEQHKAGSPTDEQVYWISMKPREIAERFFEQSGQRVSHGLVKRGLLSLRFSDRRMSKSLPTGQYGQRDLQLRIIFSLVAITSQKTPLLCIDCKKKERLATSTGNGRCYVQQGSLQVFDHDYDHLATGRLIPFGIYDLNRNQGYVSIGTSHETAEFIADALLWWWEGFGCHHYPPYASKWNPIEHRLFPHLHRAMQGVIFTDYELVKGLMEKTTTQAGLKVVISINQKQYPIGVPTKKEEVEWERIWPNPVLPQLSYRVAA
ncbi:hypothetical protein FVR03_04990 [Pontibacter qinzhouensis]|uniref:Transposase n=1 Tax=Pontibacter qinzhouensis TaxID=2603253 RepID=A0A5C8KDS3_9BACT|nr:hypothetical protein [Pontibacter qinzhouensis]TXK50539.1 hypothetical protein FVR03_04990 [Pontibacter qinzhouensis]